jgi:DMSO/TMAO reductase YedYZ molybdopterin-dependent catalytic subunit
MSRTITLVSLLITLLTVVACGEKPPKVEWELTVDGDVDQTVTYTYQDIVDVRRSKLTDILTQNPDDPEERASWEGAALLRLLKEPGGIEYDINWWALITLADGTSHRMSLADLRGALIALKDGEGKWLADTDEAPIRLIAPNKPSSQWLTGPVRITIHAP